MRIIGYRAHSSASEEATSLIVQPHEIVTLNVTFSLSERELYMLQSFLLQSDQLGNVEVAIVPMLDLSHGASGPSAGPSGPPLLTDGIIDGEFVEEETVE